MTNAWAEPSAGPVRTTGLVPGLPSGGTTTGGGGDGGGTLGSGLGVAENDHPTSASAAKSSAVSGTRVPSVAIGSSDTGWPPTVSPSAQWALSPYTGTGPPYTARALGPW